jgi:16S rRNA (adenine1518-N6/adenine1519-N6)-dimethyltransferase
MVIQKPEILDSLVKLAFSRRRKTLRNAVQGMVTEADLGALGMNAAQRPEQVDIESWVALANLISNRTSATN